MRMLDLFSGIGGFSLAARWAGIETIQFVEKDSFCQKVLQKNFPNIPIHNDIKNFHFHQAVDIITGGFPCQPFSVAGKKKGINDDRYLWPEMLRLIRSCKPNWVVAENVVGVVAMELDNILSDLERENYETQSFIIPACAANAPHRRDRLWIIANRTCERCDVRSSDWKKRYLQENKNGNMAALQSEWEKLKPKPWQNMSAYEFIQANAGFMRINDGLPNRMDRIKSLGNAIVPQIAYVFLKAIQFCSM